MRGNGLVLKHEKLTKLSSTNNKDMQNTRHQQVFGKSGPTDTNFFC